MSQTAPDPQSAFKTPEDEARFRAAYDAVLAEWPVPFEELNIPTRLGATHVIASGPVDAPPVLLLSALAGTATAWRLNAAGLSAHHRIYAVDVIGQPGKSAVPPLIRNRRQFAEWITDLLDALGVARVSIVGCSFGGFLALSQASLTPERVERIVLISPVGGFASQYWKLSYLMRVKRPLIKVMSRFAFFRRAQAKNSTPPTPPRDLKWAALMGVMMAVRPKINVTRAPSFSTAELRAIRPRALLLIGDQERVYDPPAMLKLAQERMPGLSVALVPGADHVAAMAQPDEVNARIIEFLR